MRGRTNIVQRPAPIINGTIEEFTVSSGQEIKVGDFVTRYSETSTLYSYSTMIQYVGEIRGKLIYYYFANGSVKVFDKTTFEETISFNVGETYIGDSLINSKPACIVNDTLIILKHPGRQGSVYCQAYKFNDNMNSYTKTADMTVYSNTSNYIDTIDTAVVSDDKVLIVYSVGQTTNKKTVLYKVNSDGSLTKCAEGTSFYGYTYRANDGTYYAFTSTGVVEIITTESSVSFGTSPITFTSVGSVRKIVKLKNDVIAILGTTGIQVVDVSTMTIYSRVSMENSTQDITGVMLNDYTLLVFSTQGTSYGSQVYYRTMIYDESDNSLTASDYSVLDSLNYAYTGAPVSARNGRNFELVDAGATSDGNKVILFNYEYAPTMNTTSGRLGKVIKTWWSKENVPTSKDGNYVRKYRSGDVSIGFAKTGGNAWETVQIYVPK